MRTALVGRSPRARETRAARTLVARGSSPATEPPSRLARPRPHPAESNQSQCRQLRRRGVGTVILLPGTGRAFTETERHAGLSFGRALRVSPISLLPVGP